MCSGIGDWVCVCNMGIAAQYDSKFLLNSSAGGGRAAHKSVESGGEER